MAGDDDDLYADDQHDIYDIHEHNQTHAATRKDSLSSSATTDTTDTTSDCDHEDSTQIGRAVTTSTYHTTTTTGSRITASPSPRNRPRDSHMGSPQFRSYPALKSDIPSTPPSRRGSLRSSRISTPTTFIPSKQDRLRYSWQSLVDDDEGGKPRIHVIKIVSTASTASAGIGQEEAFGFSISNGGKRIAVYNSARIFILQTAALPVNVSQEYALKRRPLAVEILDEENILAVLADEHTVNVYDVSHQRVRRINTIRPDHPTYTIALSKTGALLAAAYEGGVEIFSLASTALSTDRRAIRSPRMDKLVFSDDASTLLGTTTRLHASSAVVVSVPLFPAAPDGTPSHEELREAWCHGLLNPENIRNSSHATFWRERGQLCNESIFAWNGLEDTFGIMHTPDLEYSNIACPIGVSQPLSAVGGLGAAIHSTPTVDESGCAVAMIVNHRTVRIYTIPQDVSDDEPRVEAHSLDHELNDEYGCPFADIRWVHSHKSIAPPMDAEPRIRGRLIVTSPGGMFDPDLAEHTVQDIEGGRIIVFDFDPQYSGQPGQLFTFTLGKAPPQALDEESLDVAAEVDLVRRRTVTQNRKGTLGQKPPSLGRTATTMSRRRDNAVRERSSPNIDQTSSIQNTPIQERAPMHLFGQSRVGRGTGASLASLSPEASRSLPDLLESTELAYEQPYTQGAPRSTGAMQRAATNANRLRFQTIEERAVERINPEGLPLPAYTEIANQPLPAKFRRLAGLDIPQTGRILQNQRLATAPPMVPELGSYPFPTQATATTDLLDPGVQNTRNRAYNINATYAGSPIGMGPPPALIGDWENVSPLVTRRPTEGMLRHQSSWETMTTSQQNTMSPPSQHSQSPVSRTTTQSSTLRSQRSFETSSFRSPPMPPSPLQRQNLSPERSTDDIPNFSFLGKIPSNHDLIPNHLGIDFRHSLLLPFDQSSPVDPRPPSSASTTAARPPIPRHANTNANGHPNAYYRALSERQTPFQRASEAALAAQRASQASVRGGDGTISAGSIPHPVLNWSPPGPSAVPPAPVLSDSTTPAPSPVHTKTRSIGSSSQHSASLKGGDSPSTFIRPDPTLRAYSAPLTRSLTGGDTSTTISRGTLSVCPTAADAYHGPMIPNIPLRKGALGRSGTVLRPGPKRSKSVGPSSGGMQGDVAAVKPNASKLREEFREVEAEGKKCVIM